MVPLFHAVGVETVLTLVAALLQERRLLLISHSNTMLSVSTMTLMSLIYPFTWSHTLIPILPRSLLECVEAPTPYVMGCNAAFRDDLPPMSQSDVIVVDLDACEVSHNASPPLPGLPANHALRLASSVRRHLYPCTRNLDVVHHRVVLPPPPPPSSPSSCPQQPTADNEPSLSRPAWMSDPDPALTNHSPIQRGIRVSFLRFFAGVFTGYWRYLRTSEFDRVAFLADCPSESHPFFDGLLESQAFSNFVREKFRRPTPDLFDAVARDMFRMRTPPSQSSPMNGGGGGNGGTGPVEDGLGALSDRLLLRSLKADSPIAVLDIPLDPDGFDLMSPPSSQATIQEPFGRDECPLYRFLPDASVAPPPTSSVQRRSGLCMYHTLIRAVDAVLEEHAHLSLSQIYLLRARLSVKRHFVVLETLRADTLTNDMISRGCEACGEECARYCDDSQRGAPLSVNDHVMTGALTDLMRAWQYDRDCLCCPEQEELTSIALSHLRNEAALRSVKDHLHRQCSVVPLPPLPRSSTPLLASQFSGGRLVLQPLSLSKASSSASLLSPLMGSRSPLSSASSSPAVLSPSRSSLSPAGSMSPEVPGRSPSDLSLPLGAVAVFEANNRDHPKSLTATPSTTSGETPAASSTSTPPTRSAEPPTPLLPPPPPPPPLCVASVAPLPPHTMPPIPSSAPEELLSPLAERLEYLMRRRKRHERERTAHLASLQHRDSNPPLPITLSHPAHSEEVPPYTSVSTGATLAGEFPKSVGMVGQRTRSGSRLGGSNVRSYHPSLQLDAGRRKSFCTRSPLPSQVSDFVVRCGEGLIIAGGLGVLGGDGGGDYGPLTGLEAGSGSPNGDLLFPCPVALDTFALCYLPENERMTRGRFRRFTHQINLVNSERQADRLFSSLSRYGDRKLETSTAKLHQFVSRMREVLITLNQRWHARVSYLECFEIVIHHIAVGSFAWVKSGAPKGTLLLTSKRLLFLAGGGSGASVSHDDHPLGNAYTEGDVVFSLPLNTISRVDSFSFKIVVPPGLPCLRLTLRPSQSGGDPSAGIDSIGGTGFAGRNEGGDLSASLSPMAFSSSLLNFKAANQTSKLFFRPIDPNKTKDVSLPPSFLSPERASSSLSADPSLRFTSSEERDLWTSLIREMVAAAKMSRDLDDPAPVRKAYCASVLTLAVYLTERRFTTRLLKHHQFPDGCRWYLASRALSSRGILNTTHIFEGRARSPLMISSDLLTSVVDLFFSFVKTDGCHVDFRALVASQQYSDYLVQCSELQMAAMTELLTSPSIRFVFFVNIFNALVVHAYIVYGAFPESRAEWRYICNTSYYSIGGIAFSLNDILFGVLMGNRSVRACPRPRFGADDPRLIFSLPLCSEAYFNPGVGEGDEDANRGEESGEGDAKGGGDEDGHGEREGAVDDGAGSGDDEEEFAPLPFDPRFHFLLCNHTVTAPMGRLFTRDMFDTPKPSDTDAGSTERDGRGKVRTRRRHLVEERRKIDSVLTAAAEMYLRTTVRVDLVERKVFLPKFMRWYQEDFGASTEKMLRSIRPFLPKNVARDINNLVQRPSPMPSPSLPSIGAAEAEAAVVGGGGGGVVNVEYEWEWKPSPKPFTTVC